MLKTIFKKKKYLDCPLMKHSLHFFYDEIRACCTNVKGPVFYPNYNGEPVDFDKCFYQRKKYIKKINSFFFKDDFLDCCNGCSELNLYLSDKKVKPFSNIIERIYFHTNMSCNAKCTYCTYSNYQKGYRYKVFPLVKQLIDKNILSKDACIYMSGGEITISPEFEDLLSLLINYLNSKIEILSSGIKYCKSIENAFIKNQLILMVSLDSSDSQTYKTIKQVDCFNQVVNNLKAYIKASDNAKNNIIMKYIIVDNVNDTIEQITRFVDFVKELGIKQIRLDFDYEKYKYTQDIKVPDYYFDLYKNFYEQCAKYNLKIEKCEQIEAILDKSKKKE